MWRLHRTPRRAQFVTDRRLAADPTFLRWLAFGLIPSTDRFEQTVEWIEGCQRVHSASDPGDWDGLTVEAQDLRLHDLHLSIVRDAVARMPSSMTMTMGVSGGYDSRGLACVVDELGLNPSMYVYGTPGMYDFDIVRLAAPVGRVRTIDVAQLSWDHDQVAALLRSRQNQQIAPRILIDPLLDNLVGPRTEITGFLNGAIMRDHGRSLGWRDAVQRFARHNDLFQFQSLLPGDSVASLLPSRPVSSSVPPLLQLEFGLRQFQRLRPHDIDGRHYARPYEDQRWVGFWLARPPRDLVGKARWIEYLTRLYPAWFPDLHLFAEGSDARRLSREWVTERRDPVAAKRIDAPATTLCWVSSYRDSASFRSFVDDCLARLLSMQVFDPTLVEDALTRLRSGESKSRAMVRGFVATQIALENGLFEEGAQ